MIVDWESICRERERYERKCLRNFHCCSKKEKLHEMYEEKWFCNCFRFILGGFYFPLLFSCFKNITHISPTSNIELKKIIFSLVLSWIPTRAVNLRHVNKVSFCFCSFFGLRIKRKVEEKFCVFPPSSTTSSIVRPLSPGIRKNIYFSSVKIKNSEL